MDGFFLETVNAVVLRRMMKRNEKDGEYHEVADSHYLCIDRIKAIPHRKVGAILREVI